jgi:hydrogenase nickel incorporation protein HypB
MCASCGCGTEQEGEPGHGGSGAHDHGHAHAHGHGHAEDHGHAHGADHAEDHGHGHGDEHAHDHDHGADHAHEHGHADRARFERAVLAKNDRLAERNRGWLAARGILAVNLVSSPGAGKTTLLERTIRDRGERRRVSVIEGDQATTRDADRIRAAGANAIQINTGAGCHLDAAMVERALAKLDPPPGSLLIIENVGNLVCPALFDLGERAKVVVASVTEGDDKPLKYPHIFRAASVVLLNKVDLAPHVVFDVARFIAFAREVNPRLRVIPVSATRGDGLAAWYEWLEDTTSLTQSFGGEIA